MTIALFIVLEAIVSNFVEPLALRCKHRCFSDCFNHFGRVLDLALGPGWSRAFYSSDRVFGSDRGGHVPRLEFLGLC